jgi:hypothetical protein
MTKEKITIGEGIAATKITLLPGRPNDLGGLSKQIWIVIPHKSGKFIYIKNIDDYQLEIFDQILSTFKFTD